LIMIATSFFYECALKRMNQFADEPLNDSKLQASSNLIVDLMSKLKMGGRY
jgi:hypothetical protein